MSTLQIIIYGVIATAVMTLFTEVTFRAINRPYHVVRILANMLRFQHVTPVLNKPQPHMIVAIVLHYFIGVLFALGYLPLVSWFPDWSATTHALVYGVLIAFIAIGGWSLFFDLHPGPPQVNLRQYLITIGIGHLFLAGALATLYQIGFNN